MPDDAYFTMAIDGQGIVHATIEAPATSGSSTGRLALAGMFIDPTGQVRGWVSSFAP